MSEREVVMAAADGSAVTHLYAAIRRRQLIAQAVGIIMERYGFDQATATDYLAALASPSGVEVSDVAEMLVRTSRRP